MSSHVSALSPAALEHFLGQTGLFLQTGPYTTCIHTAIPSVAENLALLYADYPLANKRGTNQNCFADFHISLSPPKNLRRWFNPQVLFLVDDLPIFKPLPLDQAFPMLEWGLNWCVSSYANDYLIIHAAVVEKGGDAVILPAPPGSGKSTLCAALVNRGWRLLSDELALVRVSDGSIVPLPRPVSLKNQSIDIIQNFAPDAIFSRPVNDTQKGTVAHMKAPADSVIRAAETALASWIIFPKYQVGSPTQLESLPQSRAFMRVADHSFNYSLLGVPGFETLARLIDGCPCYDFTYSLLDEAMDVFASLKRPSAGCQTEPCRHDS